MAFLNDHRKEIKMEGSLLTEADLAEFEAGLAELTDTERHILFRLMELHPVEDVLDILDSMEDEGEVPEHRYAEVAPYAKCDFVSHQKNRVQIDEYGGICVRNPSACWVPKLTLRRQIGRTIFTVTGSYEGDGVLNKKLLRIMEQSARNMEDTE